MAKDPITPEGESIAEIQLQLAMLEDYISTHEGNQIIDDVIVHLSLLKYSGHSDTDEFTFIKHFHKLLTDTLLEHLAV